MANRLTDETSPYLLQHAHNPVDWWAWGPEAFAEARRRDVPIFLSVGYSTCYWCHVMERESFEDEATARVMNGRFVCVKVDREERPDVDEIYMAATQMMTGGGGWPMSVFLEPERLRPFYCGTYFPPSPMHGRPSFTQVLSGIADAWAGDRAGVLDQAGNLAQAVAEHMGGAGDAPGSAPAALGASQVASAVRTLLQIFDRTEGGFGGAPKFPQPVYASFLLSARDAVDDETRTAIDRCVRTTLDRMAVGGLFDQVGGGFHRYCVDATWTVPHFEKMLYDNAMLLGVYAGAARIYADAFYGLIARRTFAYIRREMTAESGAFFSAQDAEVDGREGLNYLWTDDEVRRIVGEALGEADAAVATDLYGLDAGTNFRDPHHPNESPKNVLRLEDRPDAIAERRGEEPRSLLARLDAINAALLAVRDTRKPAGLDDKVLAAWNGMMIDGLVRAGAALDEAEMIDAAERAAQAVVGAMVAEDGSVARSYRSGRVSGTGVLEDHAWLAAALVPLHAAGRGGGRYLDAARRIADAAERLFAGDDGAYRDAAAGRDDLFVRARSTYDGATPSGVGVMIHALLSLAEAEDDAERAGVWRGRAMAQLRGISREVAERPVSAVNSVGAVLRVLRAGGAADLAFGEPIAESGGGPGGGAMRSSRAVEVYADAETVRVADGEPGEVVLGFRIKPGYHVLAADPAADGSDAGTGLVPLRVGLIRGGGVAIYADYPEGEPYGEALVGRDELRVHTGELRLRVAIEKADGIGVDRGEPVLGVTFQACDDSSCLEPVTIRLGVGIEIG